MHSKTQYRINSIFTIIAVEKKQTVVFSFLSQTRLLLFSVWWQIIDYLALQKAIPFSQFLFIFNATFYKLINLCGWRHEQAV